MPDWDIKYGVPARDFRVENARDIHHAGLVFQRRPLPPGAHPGRAVQFVSPAGHKAWFPWPGLIRDRDKTYRVAVTYEHGGELFTQELVMRAVDQADARKILGQGIKTIKSVEFIKEGRRGLSEEEDEAVQDFIDAWNGSG